jgi:hyperosmotically inducible periplasmic protein
VRAGITVVAVLLLSGCTALVVGGASTGGYQAGKDERSSAVLASDAAITNEINGKFRADSAVSMFNINVRTYKGIVTLTGSVGDYVARNQAGSITKATTGVEVVNNQIVVER